MFDVGVSRKKHNLRLRPQFLDLAQPVKTLVAVVDAALEVHVKQHNVRLILAQARRNVIRICHGHDVLERVFEQHLYGCQYVAVVVCNQYCSLFHRNAKVAYCRETHKQLSIF